MGLVEKVHEDRDQRLIVESAEELARQRDEHDREERCLVLVTTSLQTTAAGLQEPLEEVDEGALGTPKYYVLGGVVISVQLFTSVTRDIKPDPNQPKLVLAEYYVSVIGADRRSETAVESIRVGTLKFLDYEGLYKAISEARSYLDFDPEMVLPRIKSKQ